MDVFIQILNPDLEPSPSIVKLVPAASEMYKQRGRITATNSWALQLYANVDQSN